MLFTIINIRAKESRYCDKEMNQRFNKELVMTKKDDEDFDMSTKSYICDINFLYNDVKIRIHCHIREKCRGFAHKDCDIKLKPNLKIPIVFYNLKNCDAHLLYAQVIIFSQTESILSLQICKWLLRV